MDQKAKEIAEKVIEGLKELDRQGELARNGEKVGRAINKLKKERQLTIEQLHRKY